MKTSTKTTAKTSLINRVMNLEVPVERIEETVERLEKVIENQDEQILKLYDFIRVLEIRIDHMEKSHGKITLK